MSANVNEKNLIQFTWDEAQKRPDAVVTRDGRPVKLAGYNPEANPGDEVCGWIYSYGTSWSATGAHCPSVCPNGSDADLFLKPESVVKYQIVISPTGFDSLDAAKISALTFGIKAIAIIETTYLAGALLDVSIAHRYNTNDNA